MLSDELKMAARRVLKSALRAHLLREQTAEDTSDTREFLDKLEEAHLAEWYEACRVENPDSDEVLRYLHGYMPEALEIARRSLDGIGVKREGTSFDPSALMPQRTLH